MTTIDLLIFSDNVNPPRRYEMTSRSTFYRRIWLSYPTIRAWLAILYHGITTDSTEAVKDNQLVKNKREQPYI